jgi:hypothetical protein
MLEYILAIIIFWTFVIASEIIANKFPENRYSKFWRKHILSKDHNEDDDMMSLN